MRKQISKNKIIQRFEDYKESHCWQYQMRLDNLEKDIKASGLSESEIERIKIKDFKFHVWDKNDKIELRKIEEFILNHEWLGSMPQRYTHIFTLYYKGILSGVIVMSTPNSFSKLLGEETHKIEKLISRGACISWSPKGLASHFIMKSINWMVKNTEFRVFGAYSDPDAKELGTIYQSANFIYLGQKSGGKIKLYDKNNPQKGYFSDREIRKIGAYKRYARQLGFEWDSSWSGKKGKIFWDKMPEGIEEALRQAYKDYQSQCEVIKMKPKHKYIYIKGKNKRETKELLNKYLLHNPKDNYQLSCGRIIGNKYPSEDDRGK